MTNDMETLQIITLAGRHYISYRDKSGQLHQMISRQDPVIESFFKMIENTIQLRLKYIPRIDNEDGLYRFAPGVGSPCPYAG